MIDSLQSLQPILCIWNYFLSFVGTKHIQVYLRMLGSNSVFIHKVF